MMSFFPFGGFGFLHHLHIMLGAFFLIGLIFFTVWGLKNLKNGELKKWAVWLLVIGGLGVLLTAWANFPFGGRWGSYGYGPSMMWNWNLSDEDKAALKSGDADSNDFFWGMPMMRWFYNRDGQK